MPAASRTILNSLAEVHQCLQPGPVKTDPNGPERRLVDQFNHAGWGRPVLAKSYSCRPEANRRRSTDWTARSTTSPATTTSAYSTGGAVIAVQAPLTWTNMNKDTSFSIARESGQIVTWTGGGPAGTVTIAGQSSNLGSAIGVGRRSFAPPATPMGSSQSRVRSVGGGFRCYWLAVTLHAAGAFTRLQRTPSPGRAIWHPDSPVPSKDSQCSEPVCATLECPLPALVSADRTESGSPVIVLTR